MKINEVQKLNRIQHELNRVIKNYKENSNGKWQIKMKQTLELIKAYNPMDRGYKCYEVAYSNGKDSHALLFAHLLAKELHGVEFTIYHSVTTIDPQAANKWGRNVFKQLEEMGIRTSINRPKRTFHQLMRDANMTPTRNMRFCCADLKENHEQVSVVSTGVRADESNKRKNRKVADIKTSKGFTEYCSTNNSDDFYSLINLTNKRLRKRLFAQAKISPIIKWELSDIACFFEENNIEIAPTYTDDETGSVIYSRRLGCIGCPLTSASIQAEGYMRNPNHLIAYLNTVDKLERDSPAKDVARTGIQQLAWNMHSSKTETLEEIMKQHGIWQLIEQNANDTTLSPIALKLWKKQLEQLHKHKSYKLLGNTPFICSKCKRKSKRGKLDGVYAEHCRSLNKKLIHRQIKPRSMLCPACLAEFYETTTEEIVKMVDEFISQECDLF